MAEAGAAPEPTVHHQLLEENRRLAQRFLELEETTRRQIGKLRSANTLLTRGEADMRLLLENADIGFALLDINLRVVSANQTLCSLLGYPQSELPGESFNNYVYVGKLPIFSRMTGQSAARGRGRAAIDLVARDGRLIPCRVAVSEWLNEEGAFMGTFILVFGMGEEIRSEARIREMEETIAEAEKSRSLFLDVVSRELRTPAGGIKGMIRMLMDTDLGERQAELAGVIHSSASSLVQLVDDLVDVVRVNPADASPNPAVLRPIDLLEGVADFFGVRAEEKGLELRVKVSSAVPEHVVADIHRLRRVLVHLMDNALKFTAHGHVALSLDKLGTNLRFMVSDTGSGVRAAPGEDIFAGPAVKDTPDSRRRGGLGVGLVICRRLVAVMGGKIGFESEPDRGSEFHFTIPFALPEPGMTAEADLEPPPEAMRLPPLKILLADGNPLSRRVVKAYLQFDGHILTQTDDGLDAAGKCRTEAFDLILLDLLLPKLDGLQTLRIIRDDELAAGRKRIPALLIAPPGQLRDLDYYRRAGADGVVQKPVQPVSFMAAMAAAGGVKPLAVSRQSAPGHYAAEASGGAIRRIDGIQLVNLRQVMLGEQFLGILRFFMEDAVPVIFDLRAMSDREEPDRERIAFAAAKTGALAGYLGFSALAELLKRIEAAGRTGAEAEILHSLASELPVVTEDTLEELKRIMPDAFATISTLRGSIAEVPAQI